MLHRIALNDGSRGGDGGRVARRYNSLKSGGLSSAIEGCSSNEQMSPPPKSSSDGGCARRFGGGTCLFAGAFLPLTLKALPEKCQSSYGSATLLLICRMVAGADATVSASWPARGVVCAPKHASDCVDPTGPRSPTHDEVRLRFGMPRQGRQQPASKPKIATPHLTLALAIRHVASLRFQRIPSDRRARPRADERDLRRGIRMFGCQAGGTGGNQRQHCWCLALWTWWP